MERGLFKRIGKTAIPVDADGREAFYAVRDGATFVAEISAPKNQEQVELFFALRDLVCEATDSAREPVKEWLLERTGFIEFIWYPDGTMKVRPKSVRRMRQSEFDQFFQAALPVVQDALGTSRQDLLDRYFDLLDPSKRATARKRLGIDSPSLSPSHPETNDHQRERPAHHAIAENSGRADERELERVGRGRRMGQSV